MLLKINEIHKKKLFIKVLKIIDEKIDKKTKKLIKMEYSYKYVVSYKILYSNF